MFWRLSRRIHTCQRKNGTGQGGLESRSEYKFNQGNRLICCTTELDTKSAKEFIPMPKCLSVCSRGSRLSVRPTLTSSNHFKIICNYLINEKNNNKNSFSVLISNTTELNIQFNEIRNVQNIQNIRRQNHSIPREVAG